MRIALITGGAGDLGLAVAHKFASDGMIVAVADIDQAGCDAAAKSLPGAGHMGLALDVASETNIAAVFDRVEKDLGPISVLVHFAGILGQAAVHPAYCWQSQRSKTGIGFIPLMRAAHICVSAKWRATDRKNRSNTDGLSQHHLWRARLAVCNRVWLILRRRPRFLV